MSENGAENSLPGLPDGWEWKRLEELGEAIRGVTYKKPQAEKAPADGLIPLLRATNVSQEGGGRLTTDDVVYVPSELVKPRQYLKRGDLVIASSSGSISVVGKAAPVEEDLTATFGAFCTVFRATDVRHTPWLRWIFQSPHYRSAVSALAAGSNINNLKPADLVALQVTVPPLAEQRDIAEAIAEEFTRIEKVEADLDVLDRLEGQLRPALLRDALAGKLVAREGDQAEGVADGATPTLPPGWRLSKLSDVAAVKPGVGFSKDLQGRAEGEVAFAKVRDISVAAREHGGHLSNAANYISREEAKKLRAPMLPPGTTVTAKIGEAVRLNRRALLRITATIDNNAVGLVPGPSLVPEFLWYWSRTIDLADLARATTVPSVRKSALEALEIPVPPLDEQHEIVKATEAELTRAAEIRAASSEVRRDLSRLRRSVLHAAVAGHLGDVSMAL